MKKFFRPLTTSDVVVAIINQETTIDNTDALRNYAHSSIPNTHQQDPEAEELILLPPFAITEVTEAELLSYHFSRNNFTYNNLLNYENLLSSVDDKMRKIINNSAHSFELSNDITSEMIIKLREFCTFITQERKPLSTLSSYLKNKCLSIVRKIIKARNMQKTLDIMKFWNESNISKILSIRAENIGLQEDIGEVFRSFDQISQLLSQKKNEFANYMNLVNLVGQRKQEIVNSIYQNALSCIVKYKSDKELERCLEQYYFILQKGMAKGIQSLQQKESIFQEESLSKLIDQNIMSIYSLTLQNNKQDISIQLSRDNTFLNFYSELTRQFQKYFSNWHKVTTFHIQQNSPYKEGFIQQRTSVFQKMLEKVESSLKFSSKVNSLSLPKLIQLFSIITEFTEVGQQWMGSCKTSLKEIVTQKCQQEANNCFLLRNGELKTALLSEFNLNVLNQSNKNYLSFDLTKEKAIVREEVNSILSEMNAQKLDIISKVQKINQTQSANNQQDNRFDSETIEKDMNLYLERINSKMGLKMLKIIIQYQLRQHYLPNTNQLSQIYQHFEYVLILIYKMCLPNYMKRELEQEVFNEFSRSSKISLVKNALAKGSVEEDTIIVINSLRHSFLDRSVYGVFYDFIAAANNKYEGLSLATYINSNLYFQDLDKYEAEIDFLSQSFLMRMSEYYLLADYIEKLMEESRFPKPEINLHHQLANLKNVIASLVLYYFTTYYQCHIKRFYSQVLPLFQANKFEVKRLNEFKGSLKDYKNKMIQLYHSLSTDRYTKYTCFHVMLQNKQRQYLYKFVIDLFSRVDKINDNGRHILKQELSELGKILGSDQSNSDDQNWLQLANNYLQLSQERSEKAVLERVDKLILNFPIQWWRSNLMWFYNDCSSKEKKEFNCRLASIYLQRLTSLPKI